MLTFAEALTTLVSGEPFLDPELNRTFPTSSTQAAEAQTT